MRYSKRIFVVLFILILLIPYTAFNLSDRKTMENRNLFDFPAIPNTFSETKEFIKSVESWFNDRLGFRDQIIGIYRQLLYKIFGVHDSRYVEFGQNGAMFLHSHPGGPQTYNELFDAFMINGDYKNSVRKQEKILADNAKFAQNAAVPVIFVAIPTSPVYRFNDLPLTLKKLVPDEFRFHPPLLEALQNFKKLYPKDAGYFIYPYEAGFELQKLHNLYPEKNFHWQTSPFTLMTAKLVAEKFGINQNIINDSLFQPCTTKSDIGFLLGFKVNNNNDLCPSDKFYKNFYPENLVDGEYSFLDDKNLHTTFISNPFAPIDFRAAVFGDSFKQGFELSISGFFKKTLNVEISYITNYFKKDKVKIEDYLRQIKDAYSPQLLIFLQHNTFLSINNYPELRIFEK